MPTTHCFGECFVLGVPGTFANASVSVDEAGTVSTQTIGTPLMAEDKRVEDVPPVVEEVAQVEPPVQTGMGG